MDFSLPLAVMMPRMKEETTFEADHRVTTADRDHTPTERWYTWSAIVSRKLITVGGATRAMNSLICFLSRRLRGRTAATSRTQGMMDRKT